MEYEQPDNILQRNYDWIIQSTSTTTVDEKAQLVVPINEILAKIQVQNVPSNEVEFNQFPEDNNLLPVSHPGLKSDLNSFLATILIGGEITMHKISVMYHSIEQVLNGKGIIDEQGCITVVQELPETYTLNALAGEILKHIRDALRMSYTYTVGYENAFTVGIAALRSIENIEMCGIFRLSSIETNKPNVRVYPTRGDMFHWLSTLPVYNFLTDTTVAMEIEEKIRLLYRASAIVIGNQIRLPNPDGVEAEREIFHHYSFNKSVSSEPLLQEDTILPIQPPTEFFASRTGYAQYVTRTSLLFLLYDAIVADDILREI